MSVFTHLAIFQALLIKYKTSKFCHYQPEEVNNWVMVEKLRRECLVLTHIFLGEVMIKCNLVSTSWKVIFEREILFPGHHSSVVPVPPAPLSKQSALADSGQSCFCC